MNYAYFGQPETTFCGWDALPDNLLGTGHNELTGFLIPCELKLSDLTVTNGA